MKLEWIFKLGLLPARDPWQSINRFPRFESREKSERRYYRETAGKRAARGRERGVGAGKGRECRRAKDERRREREKRRKEGAVRLTRCLYRGMYNNRLARWHRYPLVSVGGHLSLILILSLSLSLPTLPARSGRVRALELYRNLGRYT